MYVTMGALMPFGRTNRQHTSYLILSLLSRESHCPLPALCSGVRSLCLLRVRECSVLSIRRLPFAVHPPLATPRFCFRDPNRGGYILEPSKTMWLPLVLFLFHAYKFHPTGLFFIFIFLGVPFFLFGLYPHSLLPTSSTLPGMYMQFV